LTATGHRAPTGRAGYREAVAAEWTKLRTVRSTVVLAAAPAAALPLLAVVVAATGSLQPDDTITGASLLGGASFAQLLAGVLGSILMSAEYRTGLIRVTFAACPRRRSVLAAKATVAAGVTGAATLAGATTAFAAGEAMLGGQAYASGQPVAAIAGVTLAVAAIGVLGVAAGAIVRQPAAAVTAVVGALLLPGLLAPLLGDAQRWLGGVSPTGVLQKLTQSSDAAPEAVGTLGRWPSLAVLAAGCAATLAGAAWLLGHRDA
jgi:ABC-2 type transport system permease protein